MKFEIVNKMLRIICIAPLLLAAEVSLAELVVIAHPSNPESSLSLDEAKKILGDVMRGIDPVAANRDNKYHTFSTFLEDEYGPWAAVHLKTADGTLARIKRSFSKFLPHMLSEIEPRAVERWRTKRLEDGCKQSTVNRDLVCLKGALSKAVEWGVVDAHPLAKVKQAKVDDNPIPRFLSLEESN